MSGARGCTSDGKRVVDVLSFVVHATTSSRAPSALSAHAPGHGVAVDVALLLLLELCDLELEVLDLRREARAVLLLVGLRLLKALLVGLLDVLGRCLLLEHNRLLDAAHELKREAHGAPHLVDARGHEAGLLVHGLDLVAEREHTLLNIFLDVVLGLLDECRECVVVSLGLLAELLDASSDVHERRLGVRCNFGRRALLGLALFGHSSPYLMGRRRA